MIDTKPLLLQAHAEIQSLADAVVEDFTGLDLESHSQAPADMGLLTLWDEFKEQVQNGESIFFEAYESVIQQFVRQRVPKLTGQYDSFALMAFWSLTHQDSDNFIRGGEVPTLQTLNDILVYIVYQFVLERAKEEAIEYQPGYGPDGEADAKDEDEKAREQAAREQDARERAERERMAKRNPPIEQMNLFEDE